jgi:glycosyltransferase involved in cell wall biosynthesis
VENVADWSSNKPGDDIDKRLRIVFFTIDLSDNSLGRTFVLWMLARSLGWQTTVVSPLGEAVWGPMRGTEFAADCIRVTGDWEAESSSIPELVREADLLVAVKSLPESFARALRLSRRFDRPLLLDVDDPDLEGRLSVGHPLKAAAKAVLKPRMFWSAAKLWRPTREFPYKMVSSPALQRVYGGAVVPHVREDSGVGVTPREGSTTVVFVGTVRRHKGIGVLRAAIARLQPVGYRLVVTDDAPSDAHPWERWVGRTTFEDGMDLVKAGDVVVIPSMPNEPMAKTQLPAKLIDAMLAGRAVIGSDFEPIRWALDGAGVLVRPGDEDDLVRALAAVADPAVRDDLGAKARRRALELMTVDAVAPVFRQACFEAIRAAETGARGR